MAAETPQGLFSPKEIGEAIRAHGAPAEVWGDPIFNDETGEWEAIVAPFGGPLLRMRFRMKLGKVK